MKEKKERIVPGREKDIIVLEVLLGALSFYELNIIYKHQ